MKRYKKYLVLGLLVIGQKSYCQKAADTAALVKEFTTLMSTTAQPYLYYSCITKAGAEPVVLAEDTITTTGVFYKVLNDIYYSSGQDEMYIQDSFKLQINHERKTIWISKINEAAKEKVTMLPVNNKQFKTMLQKKFTISKSIIDDSTDELNFETRQNTSTLSNITTTIQMDYIKKTYLLKNMNITMRIQEPAGDNIVAALKSEGVDETKLIQTIDSVKYLIRKQSLNTTFINIDPKKETAMQMPSWKNVVEYDTETKEFRTKGSYKEYTITKMF
jgi:hypothetical protein